MCEHPAVLGTGIPGCVYGKVDGVDLRQIEYFLAVAGGESLSTAAQNLSVTKPSLSQGIRGLERELGVELFHRVGRGLVLTAAGRALVGPARQMTRSSAAAFDVAIGTADEPRGRLDICSAAHGLEGPIARIVADFRERWPAVTVRSVSCRRVQRLSRCWQTRVRGGLQLLATRHVGAVHESVGGERVLAGSAVGGSSRRLAEWCETRCGRAGVIDGIARSPRGGCAQTLAGSACHRVVSAGRRARTRMSTELAQRETVGAFVFAGLGMAFMERSLAERSVASGAEIFPVEPAISLNYGVEFDPETLSPLGRLFVEGL